LSQNFLTDNTTLTLAPAVSIILCDNAGHYLIQERDDIPGIWYPGYHALFGGAIEADESPVAAMRRELVEELALDLPVYRLDLFARLDIYMLSTNLRERYVFTTTLNDHDIANISLGEGKAMHWMTGAQVLSSDVLLSSYDALALFLHYNRHRIK